MNNNKITDGWKIVKLSDIADISAGGTPRRNVQEYWKNGDIPWLKISDLKNTYVNSAEEKINQNGLKNSSAKIFPIGTLVYSIFATLGAMSILEIPAATNQAIAGIIPNNTLIDTKYLYYCLHSEKNNILSKKSHATQDNINLTILRNHEIPLPPLPTQKKIAVILEKAKKLREWRKKADGLTDEFLKSTFLEMFGNHVENPKGWEKSTIDAITVHHKQGFYTNSGYTETGIKLIRITDITEYGSLTYDDMPRLDLDSKTTEQFKVQKGDFLFARSGVSIGRCAIVEKDIPCVFGSYIIRFRFDQNRINNKFFLFLMKFPQLQSNLKNYAHGSTNTNINAENIKNIAIFIPPLLLQEKFASFVQQIEQVRQHQKQSKQQIDHFFNLLMQKAFNGGEN